MNRAFNNNVCSHSIILIIIVFISLYSASAQIPKNSFYHSRETVLPYATFSVLYPDGTQKNIPFAPVIVNHKPTGIPDFFRDFEVRRRLVFAGPEMELYQWIGNITHTEIII